MGLIGAAWGAGLVSSVGVAAHGYRSSDGRAAGGPAHVSVGARQPRQSGQACRPEPTAGRVMAAVEVGLAGATDVDPASHVHEDVQWLVALHMRWPSCDGRCDHAMPLT